jgi:hypothetical protein
MNLTELNLILDKVGKTPNEFDLFIETGSFMGETLNNLPPYTEKKRLIIEIKNKL